MKNPVRDEWVQMQIIDDMHTLLADDCRRAGDYTRQLWHIEKRDQFRRSIDAAASIFCGREVTGYTGMIR